MVTKIDETCRSMVETVDGALAGAVFELESGALLGGHESRDALQEAAVAAAADLVQSPDLAQLERGLRALRGLPAPEGNAFREIHVSSADREYLARTLDSSTAVMLVMKKTTNVGMGYAQLRAAGPVLESLVSDRLQRRSLETVPVPTTRL